MQATVGAPDPGSTPVVLSCIGQPLLGNARKVDFLASASAAFLQAGAAHFRAQATVMVSNDVPRTDTIGEAAESKSAPSGSATDRRRPGRVDYINPDFIVLLRQPAGAEPAEFGEQRDDLAPIKGILFGLLLAIPVWMLIGLAIWYWL
jgi:hypothetical protein